MPATSGHVSHMPRRACALGQVRGALDRAPHRQVQVDLAAVCLRIVARERRDRVWRASRWESQPRQPVYWALASLRLLNIAIEPGRLTVAWSRQAWQHAPVQSPTEGGSPAIRASHDASSLVTTSPTTEPRSVCVACAQTMPRCSTTGAFDGALLGGFAARARSRRVRPRRATHSLRSYRRLPGTPRRTTTTCASNCSRRGGTRQSREKIPMRKVSNFLHAAGPEPMSRYQLNCQHLPLRNRS